MKAFCPQIHNLCEDGYPFLKDEICTLWDQDTNTCLYTESLKGTVEVFKNQRAPIVKPKNAKTAKLPELDNDKLGKILKGLNLGEE